MDGISFVLLTIGDDGILINEVLDAYDVLADAESSKMRRVGLRRLLSSTIRDHPRLGEALHAAKSLGQSSGRTLSSEAGRLLSQRRYTPEDIDSINTAIDEAMTPDFVLPYTGKSPKVVKGSGAFRRGPPSYGERTDDPSRWSSGGYVSITDRSYERMLAQLIPLGYSVEEVAGAWERINGKDPYRMRNEAPRESPYKGEESPESSPSPPPKTRKRTPAKNTSKRTQRTFADRVAKHEVEQEPQAPVTPNNDDPDNQEPLPTP